jgi:hypothetical protein
VKPRRTFLNQPKQFWAYVRSISESLGYTARRRGQVKVPAVVEIEDALEALGLDARQVVGAGGQPTELGALLLSYFNYRAEVLNAFVEPRLMDAERARGEFERLRRSLGSAVPVPMNKQKGEKKAPAFLTAIVNMLIHANAEGLPCVYDPRQLTSLTRRGALLRTLARRVDGAFPGPVNPVAVWEIKEYYYTTTFGSRVADGVYESLLDGMELEELRASEGVRVLHYLMVDGHYTWWDCGRSYLCRILDMLHMGYVDEVLFGYEVLERLPSIVQGWVRGARRRT